MKFDMDLKTLVMIISTACALAGFYYSTQARLDVVEAKMDQLETNDQWFTKQIKNLKRSGKK